MLIGFYVRKPCGPNGDILFHQNINDPRQSGCLYDSCLWRVLRLIEKRNRWMDSFIFALCLTFNDPALNLRWESEEGHKAVKFEMKRYL